jgi:uncharacterized protein (TIGR03000 family)
MFRNLLSKLGPTALAVGGLLLLAGPAAAQVQGWPLMPDYGRYDYGPSYGPRSPYDTVPEYTAPAAGEEAVTPAAPEENPYLTTAAVEAPEAATLSVRLPAGAEIWFNNTRMPQTGADRRFVSPPLMPGEDYHYTVRVRWHEGNRTVTRSREVPVHAGDRLNLVFGQNGAGGAGR